MIVVLDASVALKWSFTDEEATNEALALRDDFVEGRVECTLPEINEPMVKLCSRRADEAEAGGTASSRRRLQAGFAGTNVIF